ncbi:MAG: amidohydrolase [Saprospiraceae bacterium]
MKENLRITTVQSALHWENPAANLAMFTEKLKGLEEQTDVVILPEMFTTGFSMNATALAEEMDGPAMQWLEKQAARLGAVVTGSFIAEEEGRYYNRLVWMQPGGTFETYDKRHLFTLAGEHETYTAGIKKPAVEWQGWRICPLICYDLRFPVWSRNAEGYDLLIYMANWPGKRGFHWRQLLMARAIENQTFVVGVNRVGEDENGHVYAGDTSVIDYSGKLIYRVSGAEDVFTTALSLLAQKDYRRTLQFLPDRDDFHIVQD